MRHVISIASVDQMNDYMSHVPSRLFGRKNINFANNQGTNIRNGKPAEQKIRTVIFFDEKCTVYQDDGFVFVEDADKKIYTLLQFTSKRLLNSRLAWKDEEKRAIIKQWLFDEHDVFVHDFKMYDFVRKMTAVSESIVDKNRYSAAFDRIIADLLEQYSLYRRIQLETAKVMFSGRIDYETAEFIRSALFSCQVFVRVAKVKTAANKQYIIYYHPNSAFDPYVFASYLSRHIEIDMNSLKERLTSGK